MRLADSSIRHPVTTAMVAIGLLVFGAVGISRMPVDIYPNVTLPMIIVATVYPGAGPLEVESEVSRTIEQRIGNVSNLKEITSRSIENISVVQLQFEWGANLDAASADVRDRLDMAVSLLPDEAQKPFIFKFDPSMMPVLQIALSGDIDPMALRDLAEDFETQMQRVPGVASVSTAGGTRRQVQVSVDLRRLAAAGITNEQFNQMLQAQNLNYPVGSVTSTDTRYLIRLIGQYQDLDAVRNTVIGSRGNVPVLVKDVAEVGWRPEEVQSFARFNGRNCVFSIIQRRPDANTVKVAAAALAQLDRIRPTLPAGVKADVIFDSSLQIKQSINNVAANLIIGGILAVMVLFVFLRRFRATMFVAFSIPISIFFAMLFMYIFGFTVNILSMAGLAIAVGMVVDNAIVAFESIYRHREEGDDPVTASGVGTNEIAMAITASTLTTVVVFLPMLLLKGMLQIFFREMVWSVTSSLMASLAVALTLIPMLSSRFLPRVKVRFRKGEGEGARPLTEPGRGLLGWSERFYDGLERGYGRLIGWAVSRRRLVVLGAVVLLVGSLGLVPFIGTEFLPDQESWFHQINAELPVGADVAATNRAALELERDIMEKWSGDLDGIAAQVGAGSNMYAAIFGSTGSNYATLNLMMKSKTQRRHSIEEIDRGIRAKAATIPGLKVRSSDHSMTSMMGGNTAVEVDIMGHDLATADTISREVMAAIETIPGLVDLKSSREPGKPEIQLVVDRQKAALFGLSPYQIGAALRTQIEGNAVSQYRLGGREYDILVRLNEDQRNSIADVLGLTVNGPLGTVPIKNLVSVKTGTSPLEIEHKNSERIVRITGRAVGISPGQLGRRVGRAIAGIPAPPGFDIHLSGSYEDMVKTFKDLGFIVLIALVLVYMVMASQFESFRDPFIIMFTVPFGLIGVLWALFLTRTAISVTSGLGLLILIGVVVNNGIVYIDYCNQLRRNRGMALLDAVKEAGRVRLRPILMTSLTTIFGLIPLAFQLGEGSELWSPLGRAMIGGMIVSTFLPLVFIPVLYVIFENRSERRRLRLAARAATDRARSESGTGK